MTSLTLALCWTLAIVTVLNAWWARGNERRARELDAFAEELLRDRANVMKAWGEVVDARRVLADDRESISVFVALNPLARLKAPSPEA